MQAVPRGDVDDNIQLPFQIKLDAFQIDQGEFHFGVDIDKQVKIAGIARFIPLR